MAVVAFADESGTTGGTSCYAIGIVSVQDDQVAAFECRSSDLLESHGVQGEAKWSKVRGSHGLTNFALDALALVLASGVSCYDVIVVNKALFRNWQSAALGHEAAFYQTYTYLLKHVVRRARQTATVYIDDRSDHYTRRTEVVEAIGNAMLAQLQSTGRLQSVVKVPSVQRIGIQVADLLTGAVSAAHERWLDASTPINHGKAVTIERLAALVGWDDLCYDTMPSDRFNIWHFPKEFRATPATRAVRISERVQYVAKTDLQ